MTGIRTKPAAEPRQVRFETVFLTSMSPEQLEEFQHELTSEICGHIEDGKGEEHVITTYQEMDDVSAEESERLQEVYLKAVGEGGLDQPAGAAVPVRATTGARRR